MKLYAAEDIRKNRKKLTVSLIVFFAILAAALALYAYSFVSGVFWIPFVTGLAGAVVSILFYFLVVFEKAKLSHFFDSAARGITQTDTYRFESFDGLTEHDGVRLMSVKALFEDEGQTFDRSLYFLDVLPYPDLKKGDVITVTTHQNVIIELDKGVPDSKTI